MSEAIILPQFPPDLSGYALSNHTHSNYAALSHSHSGYASSSHSHSGYATQTWVTNNFAPKGSGGGTTGGDSGTTGGNSTFSWNSSKTATVYKNGITMINDWNPSGQQSWTIHNILASQSISIPSTISTFKLSWTSMAMNFTASGCNTWIIHGNDTEGDSVGSDGASVVFALAESPWTLGMVEYKYGTVLPTNIVGCTSIYPSGGYQAYSGTGTTAANSVSIGSATIAKYAGKTIYLLATLRGVFNNLHEGSFSSTTVKDKSITAAFSNTVNFTVTTT